MLDFICPKCGHKGFIDIKKFDKEKSADVLGQEFEGGIAVAGHSGQRIRLLKCGNDKCLFVPVLLERNLSILIELPK